MKAYLVTFEHLTQGTMTAIIICQGFIAIADTIHENIKDWDDVEITAVSQIDEQVWVRQCATGLGEGSEK